MTIVLRLEVVLVILSTDQILMEDAGRFCNHKFDKIFCKMIVSTVAIYSIMLSK